MTIKPSQICDVFLFFLDIFEIVSPENHPWLIYLKLFILIIKMKSEMNQK